MKAQANTEKILLEKISELEAELKKAKKQKKFGLVWEDKPEQVVEDCKRSIPILRLKEKKKGVDPVINIGNPKGENLLIEGDNYHSLSVLNYTHAGKIDAIYADPPYNTGAKNWIYNNDYVDGNDVYRHSKWLSFMERRLVLAKSLLKKEGIIVVTIDDFEIATLTLLMNEIFGEENHLGTVVIKSNPSGRSTTSGFSVSHEYALFYGKSSSAVIGRLQRNEDQIARYKEKDDVSNFEWVNFRARYSTVSPRLQYPLFIKNDASDFRIPDLSWNVAKREFELLEKPAKDEFIKYPIDDANQLRTWKWGIETVRSQKETDMTVRLDQKKQPTVYVKARMSEEGMLPLTWWDKTEYSATAYGTNLLSKLMSSDDRFNYPKSLYAVIDSLKVLSSKKDATFLDFFAGSGTTGHAVLQLNNEDGGNRKFILCTNNENGICEEITYQRISRIIKGYKDQKGEDVDGLGGSLRYYKTDLVDIDKLQQTPDDAKVKLAHQAGEMIGLREGTPNEVEKNEWWQIFEGNGRMSAVYFKEDKEKLKDLIKILEEKNQLTALYIFGWGKNEHRSEYGSTKIRVEDIPEPILEVYKEINRL